MSIQIHVCEYLGSCYGIFFFPPRRHSLKKMISIFTKMQILYTDWFNTVALYLTEVHILLCTVFYVNAFCQLCPWYWTYLIIMAWSASNTNNQQRLQYRWCALSPNKWSLSPVTFYSITVDKLLIVFPLSRMCWLGLTLPPPHGRWYNGCYKSRSHIKDGQNRIIFPKLVKYSAGHCPKRLL